MVKHMKKNVEVCQKMQASVAAVGKSLTLAETPAEKPLSVQEAAFETLLVPVPDKVKKKTKKKKNIRLEAVAEPDEAERTLKSEKKQRKKEDDDAADKDEQVDVPVKKKKKRKSVAPVDVEKPAAAEKLEEGEKGKPKKTKKMRLVAADGGAEEDEDEVKKTDPFKKKDPNAAVAYKVCVSQLPWSVDEATIRKDFAECGDLSTCVLLTEKKNGFVNSRGIAFLSYTEEEGRQAALKYNGTEYGGRFIKVNPALEREERKSWQESNSTEKGDRGNGKGKGKDKGKDKGKGKGKPRAPLGPKPQHCTSVIMKSLPSTVAEDDIQNFFKDCGKQGGPTNIRIIQSSAGKRLAFVDFDDTNAVDQAIELNGTDWKGGPAHLDYSKPREHKIRTPKAEW